MDFTAAAPPDNARATAGKISQIPGDSDRQSNFQPDDNEPNKEKVDSSFEPQTPFRTSKKRKNGNVETPVKQKKSPKKIRARVIVDFYVKKKIPKKTKVPKPKPPKTPKSSTKIPKPTTPDKHTPSKRRKYETKAAKDKVDVQDEVQIHGTEENLRQSCKRSLAFDVEDSQEESLVIDTQLNTGLDEKSTAESLIYQKSTAESLIYQKSTAESLIDRKSTEESLINETQGPEISRWAHRKNILYYRRRNKRLALVNAFKSDEIKSSSKFFVAKNLLCKKRRTTKTKVVNSDVLKLYTNQITAAVNLHSELRFKSTGKRSARRPRSCYLSTIVNSNMHTLSTLSENCKLDNNEESSMADQLSDSQLSDLNMSYSQLSDVNTNAAKDSDELDYIYDWKTAEFSEWKKIIREPIKDVFAEKSHLFDECQSQNFPSPEVSLDKSGRMKKLLIDIVTARFYGIKISDLEPEPERGVFVGTGLELVLFNNDNQSLVVSRPEKPKIYAKIDLDPTSNRRWEMWLNNETQEEETDEEKAKVWEQEKIKFALLYQPFIQILRGVLGNRKFSKWNGSVMDSIVGVFLTQNVTDVLSSTTFMNVAKRFPAERFPYSSDESESVKLLEYLPHSPESESVGSNDVPAPLQEDSSFNSSQTIGKELVMYEESTIPSIDSTKSKKVPVKTKKRGQSKNEEPTNWEEIKNKYWTGKTAKDSPHTRDMVDWDLVRRSKLSELVDAIKIRGMHNQIGEKIMNLLVQIYRDHGSTDLEWLRNLTDNQTKEFLLSIRGIGLKSTECIRLLSLQQKAFPVDTNIARVTVRLGWVPIRELQEGAEFHDIDIYPLDDAQRYLWARLMDLPVETLYELHYILITFGKTFCNKTKPRCNICPMKNHCKYYASVNKSPMQDLPDIEDFFKPDLNENQHVPPEMPTNPSTTNIDTEKVIEAEPIRTIYGDDRDIVSEDELSDDEYSDDDSNPIRDVQLFDEQIHNLNLPKQHRLRTIHTVYEIPDNHELISMLELDPRVADDVNPYLFTIWLNDEKEPNSENPKIPENSGSSNERRIVQYNPTVRGTILIPCRTANRGSFPLNGTYFQTNEVFADHATTVNPVEIPSKWLNPKNRRVLYCGKGTSSMFSKAESVDEIRTVFNEGYICVRAFDRRTRNPMPIPPKFHIAPTPTPKKKV